MKKVTDTPTEREGDGAWARMRRRKVVQWGLAYVAAAWTLLQALEYATGTFHWPEPIRPLATIAVLVGLPVVLVIAWYHGDRGDQRVSGAELVILALLLLGGGSLLWLYEPSVETVRAPRPSPETVATAQPAVPTGASVAVLPFAALSSGKDDGYFADGVTEEIINALTSLPDLLVTARTSAFYFRAGTYRSRKSPRRLAWRTSSRDPCAAPATTCVSPRS